MAWTSPPTVTAGSAISAATFGNVVRDDLNHLYNGKALGVQIYTGTNLNTTTSTSFGTAGSAFYVPLTVGSGRILVMAHGWASMGNVASAAGYFTLSVGTAQAGTLAYVGQNITAFIHMAYPFTSVSAGAYNIAVQFKTSGFGTLSILPNTQPAWVLTAIEL